MRYSVPLFALALTAVADPTATLKRANAVKRDLTTVTSVLADVDSLTQKLDSAITGYSGNYGAVQSAADALSSAITKGISAVSSGGKLSLTDALGVQAPVQKLTATVNQTVQDTVAKKQTFVSSGHGGDVLKTLQTQKTGADNLSKAISAQVPQEVSSLAATLSAGISNALQSGIDQYQDQAGKSSGGSSSASAPSAASSGTAPSAASSGTAPAASSASSGSSSGSTSSSSGSSGSSSGSSSSAASPSSPATTSSPAQFTGAGSMNGFSVAGLLAAVAVVLAF